MQKNKLKYVITSIALIASMFLQIAYPTIAWAVNEIKELITEEHLSEEPSSEEQATEHQLPEDQILQEQPYGEEPNEEENEGPIIEKALINFMDAGEGDTSDLVVEVLDMEGTPFPNVELELVRKTSDGYKRINSTNPRTNDEGKVCFSGFFEEMILNPEVEYGIIATGWIQTPAFEPVIWFTPLSSASNNITISLESEDPEYPSVYRFVLNPVDEEGSPLYGDRQYIIIKGIAYDGILNDSSYTKVLQYPGYPMPIYLPEGQYVISASFEYLYGSGQEEPWPNYFISKEITIPVDIPKTPTDSEEEGYQTITIGGQNLAKITLNPNIQKDFTNQDYIIPAISLFPKMYYDQEYLPKEFSNPSSASIMYIQKFGENAREIYISPGKYNIISALSNHSSETNAITTYFIEKELIIGESEEKTLYVNDIFTSTITTDKTTYNVGDTIALTHEIKDSNGNRLIAKAQNLPIVHEEAYAHNWKSETPILKILNAADNEVDQVTSSKNNKMILEKWNGWQPLYNDVTSELVSKPGTDNTFYSSEYTISQSMASGVYKIRLDLGKGSYTNTHDVLTLKIEGEETSPPVLNPIVSPTNAADITIRGVAKPETEISIYYALKGGEKTLIETTIASETGSFEINFAPEQEGIYTITANDSQPVIVVIDRTAPGKPLNLQGVSPDDKTINLTWNAPEGEVVEKYEVWRNGTLVGTIKDTGDNILTYTDTGLANRVEYKYEVKAMDLAGNESESAEIVMFTKEKAPDLKISSFKWIGSWDNRDHLNVASDIDITIAGTAGKSAKAVIEYADTNDAIGTVEFELQEVSIPDGASSEGVRNEIEAETNNETDNVINEYKGLIRIPDGTKTITKITGIIYQDEYKAEMEADNLPVSVNGGMKIKLSDETLVKLQELKGAELSLLSRTKNSGGKAVIDESAEYTITGLIPSSDYELKLTKNGINLGDYKGIEISGGLVTEQEFSFIKAPATLSIRVLNENGDPFYGATVRITSLDGTIIASGNSLVNQNGWVSGYSQMFSEEGVPKISNNRLEGETLKVTADVSWYAWKIYDAPVVKEVTLTPGHNVLTITIPNRPKARIFGKVMTQAGKPLSDASIIAYTKVGDGEIDSYVMSDDEGNYSLEVIAGEVRLTVMHRLSETKEYILGEPLAANEEREYQIDFPIEKRILIDVRAKSIGDSDYYYNYIVDNNTRLTIKNTGQEGNPKNEVINSIKGSELYFSVPKAEPGDIIEITADGSKAGYGKSRKQ